MKVARKNTLWPHVLVAVFAGLILSTSMYVDTLNTVMIKLFVLVTFIISEALLHYKYNDYSLATLSEYILVSLLIFITLLNSQLSR